MGLLCSNFFLPEKTFHIHPLSAPCSVSFIWRPKFIILGFSIEFTFVQSSPLHPTRQRHVPGLWQYPFCLLQFTLQMADRREAGQLERKMLFASTLQLMSLSHLARIRIHAIPVYKCTPAVCYTFPSHNPAALGNLCRFFPSIRCDTFALNFFINLHYIYSSGDLCIYYDHSLTKRLTLNWEQCGHVISA